MCVFRQDMSQTSNRFFCLSCWANRWRTNINNVLENENTENGICEEPHSSTVIRTAASQGCDFISVWSIHVHPMCVCQFSHHPRSKNFHQGRLETHWDGLLVCSGGFCPVWTVVRHQQTQHQHTNLRSTVRVVGHSHEHVNTHCLHVFCIVLWSLSFENKILFIAAECLPSSCLSLVEMFKYSS